MPAVFPAFYVCELRGFHACESSGDLLRAGKRVG
jgi:hypothetical protein